MINARKPRITELLSSIKTISVAIPGAILLQARILIAMARGTLINENKAKNKDSLPAYVGKRLLLRTIVLRLREYSHTSYKMLCHAVWSDVYREWP